jgi:hypothetical protein
MLKKLNHEEHEGHEGFFIKSFWESGTLFSKRVLAAGGSTLRVQSIARPDVFLQIEQCVKFLEV